MPGRGNKTIGYTRRSREQEQAYSLDEQEARIQAWATFKDHHLDDVLREDDVSGSVALDERPLLGPVLADLQEGDTLVVARLDRLSRSLHDFASPLERAKQEGWNLVCLDPELDLTTASGRLIAQVFAALAEYERSLLIERLHEGRRAKSRGGGYSGGHRIHPRYGFTLVERDGKREWDPVPHEQEAIAEMRRLRDQGMTLQETCEVLEHAGIPGPTGNGWSPPTIHRILKRA